MSHRHRGSFTLAQRLASLHQTLLQHAHVLSASSWLASLRQTFLRPEHLSSWPASLCQTLLQHEHISRLTTGFRDSGSQHGRISMFVTRDTSSPVASSCPHELKHGRISKSDAWVPDTWMPSSHLATSLHHKLKHGRISMKATRDIPSDAIAGCSKSR